MLARLLRRILGALLVLFGALGYWIGARGWPGVLACAVGGLLLALVALVAASFFVAHPQRAARPAGSRIGVPSRLRLWTVEYFAAALTLLVLQPFERWFVARDPGAPKGPPVLLVHGYANNSAALWSLARFLRREGFSVFTHDLEPVFASIDAYIPALAARLGEVLKLSGAPGVNVVCHSMGGLVLRACLRERGGAGIARVVTLGAPHHGTGIARMGFGVNARQMRIYSQWLLELQRSEAGAFAAPLTSIYTWDDNIVAPQSSAELQGAKNIALEGMGHISLPFSREFRQLVLGEIHSRNRE